MRPARLIPSRDRLAVLLVAHGSRDPRAAAATEALARAVRRAHPSWDVHAAYLDHAGPRPLDVLAGLAPGRRAVLVPLLLTKAYHGRVDIPAVVEAAQDLPVSVTLAEVLGPQPAPLRTPARPAVPAHRTPPPGAVPSLLIDGLIRRLPATGLDAVVLAAAGTRNPAARATVEWAANALSGRLSLPCTVAYASAASPLPGAAVDLLRASGARRIGMAAYFLAPGHLYDLAADSARTAGAVTIATPLTDAPELVNLVAARVNTVATRASAAA
ncbi:sirohydrochlorin chelatase [Paractinoplanes toevensis]|uniref:Cobalamin biosynthesis protein n=1 Tax=Paractinoplanes toevensis TaxID=571911 RepID=A0A919TBK0_9ACTN|nr:CbiX/SirB N-terminal domain-containing protein [Actinoplanes toevensis]GIM92550.1 cobalamin biosynthesis protein [Actinoplanes toevensis]